MTAFQLLGLIPLSFLVQVIFVIACTVRAQGIFGSMARIAPF